jgi:hypothetical protein
LGFPGRANLLEVHRLAGCADSQPSFDPLLVNRQSGSPASSRGIEYDLPFEIQLRLDWKLCVISSC